MSLVLLEQARKDGNAAFGAGDYEKAAALYEAALDEEEASRLVKDGEQPLPPPATEGVLIEEILEENEVGKSVVDDDPLAAATAAAEAAAPAAAEQAEQQPPLLHHAAAPEVAQLRAVLLSNLAAARIKQERWEAAAAAATRAIDSGAVQNEKALERRAHARERMEGKEDEALSDYKALLERCPERRGELASKIRELERKIAERNERLKAEMMDKLKQFGNFCLKPFGLSTDSFQMVPNGEGGYSLNMKSGN